MIIPELIFTLHFLDAIFLQMDFFGFNQGFGSEDPIIKGVLPSVFAIIGFAVILNLFNAGVRRKMVDQVKLKRIMKETRAWQKERMAAFRSKDQERIASINKKSAYMNKMSMEMMQMNMRPMMITIIPLLLIFYLVLPQFFFFTVGVSPVSLNVIPGDFLELTCSVGDVVATVNVEDEITGEVLKDENGENITKDIFCEYENGIRAWAWYLLASIALSGMIMKLTKTTMDIG